MLTLEDFRYLLDRSYTKEMIDREEICSLPENTVSRVEGIEIRPGKPTIAFTCRSMSNEVSGIHTACRLEHDYQYYQFPGRPYLPIWYGSEEDRTLLFQNEQLILVEGTFDRVAMKRMLPGEACFGRLSKGASGQLAVTLPRYAKRLWTSFDMDEAGEKAADRAEKRLTKMEVTRLLYPAKDPSELLKKYGLSNATHIIKNQFERLNF